MMCAESSIAKNIELCPVKSEEVIDRSFEEEALHLFHHQSEHNQLYADYLRRIGVVKESVNTIDRIPFLPISFFKTHLVQTGQWEVEAIFRSSGTTGSESSKHLIQSLDRYKMRSSVSFEKALIDIHSRPVLAVVPGYAEHSSLVTMLRHFIELSNHPDSGFYDRTRFAELYDRISSLDSGQEAIVFGVTHGLLDFVEEYPLTSSHHLMIVETGGMKGRTPELTREEVHRRLAVGFRVDKVYAEYGMAELSSQVYTDGDLWFNSHSRMRAYPGDLNDPLSSVEYGTTCRINIIDLENSHSCAFIATEDIGVVLDNGRFRIMGRLDRSDIRGCSLMMA